MLQNADISKNYRIGRKTEKTDPVVGTSGSGKSTLLNMMGGLDTPTSGSVIVRGQELAKKNDEELTINLAVLDSHNAVGKLGDFVVVGNHYDSLMKLHAGTFQQTQYIGACFAVQVTRRLVCKNDSGFGNPF